MSIYTLASLQCRDGACRGFTDEADIASTKAKRREVSGESREEGATFEADLCYLHMDESLNEMILFPVWAISDTAMGVLCNCLLGALT